MTRGRLPQRAGSPGLNGGVCDGAEYCEATETQSDASVTESSQDAMLLHQHQQQHSTADYVTLTIDADANHDVCEYCVNSMTCAVCMLNHCLECDN